MSNEWPMLTYRLPPADVRKAPEVKVGDLLGFDETYRPYEVIDIEIEGDELRLYLGYASGDTVKAQRECYDMQLLAESVRQQTYERKVFGRG